jgi:hypothetical protein
MFLDGAGEFCDTCVMLLDRADAGIDRSELQVRKEGMKG